MLGEFGQLLRAIANGPDPARLPAPSEVIPTFPVIGAEPSFCYPRGEYIYGGYALEAASAGVRSHVGLYNPSGSGVLATVKHMEGVSGTSSRLLLTVATAAQVAAMDNDGSEHAMDTRIRIGTTSNRPNTCNILTDQAAQIGTVLMRCAPDSYIGTDFAYHMDFPFVLMPGAALIALPASDNMALTFAFIWHERRYDQAEIAGTRAGQFD